MGYSLNDLVTHLERQIAPGMTWANYGKWHIDHVRPVSSFSYVVETDPAFRECWALANLRPLWAKANIIKGGKRVLLL